MRSLPFGKMDKNSGSNRDTFETVLSKNEGSGFSYSTVSYAFSGKSSSDVACLSTVLAPCKGPALCCASCLRALE